MIIIESQEGDEIDERTGDKRESLKKPSMKIAENYAVPKKRFAKKTSLPEKITKKIFSPERKHNKDYKIEEVDKSISTILEEEKKVEEDRRNSMEKSIIFEGAIYRYTKDIDHLTTIWMVLIGQDVYYYTDPNKIEYSEFHHLSGCFIKENGEVKIKGQPFFSFSIIFSSQVRNYYSKERSNAKEWTQQLRKYIGYQNFFDFYEMIDDLDEGHFGVVKLGIHSKTKQKVAIKILHKKKMKEKEIGLMQREIDIMKMSKHPNIVRFLDHFENSEYIFIVMEYIQGGNLRDYLKTQKKMTEPVTARIISQVASGIKYLQGFGIIHRDIKPDNIMVANAGEKINVKIADFGLSKILAPGEKTTEGYGTLTYVAPEIVRRVPYSNSIDIWSVGIMTYFLVTRTLPFDDEFCDSKKLAKKIVNSKLPFPEQLWKNKSKELIIFLEQCLQKDENSRLNIDQLLKHEWILKNMS